MNGKDYIKHTGLDAYKEIDFSCKKDILIRNSDGTYTPMDEPYYEVEVIVPSAVWKILSSGDYSYLVAGDQEAIAIDSGYGAGNIRRFMQTLTDVPVKNIINTHHHFDHTANNGYFEKAYMDPHAIPLATVPFASFAGIDFPADYERVPVEEGYVFDLGGKTLEVFSIPDHTQDGIALLDRKDRILFTGDEFMAMGKNLSNASIQQFYEYLVKLEAHRGEFDTVCAGAGVFPGTFLDSFYECAKYILDGHYGEPVEARAMKFADEFGPGGEVVYDRMRPHPGDGGAGKAPQDNKVRYRVEYAGTSIVYDRNDLA